MELTIFCPPGPEPFRYVPVTSDSSIFGRGGICLTANGAVVEKGRIKELTALQ